MLGRELEQTWITVIIDNYFLQKPGVYRDLLLSLSSKMTHVYMNVVGFSSDQDGREIRFCLYCVPDTEETHCYP